MVTATETRCRITLALESTELMLHDLPDIAAEWDHLGDGERASWAIDWSNEMSALKWVWRQASDGAITPAHLYQFRRLQAKLLHHVPALAKLNLYTPAFIVEAR